MPRTAATTTTSKGGAPQPPERTTATRARTTATAERYTTASEHSPSIFFLFRACGEKGQPKVRTRAHPERPLRSLNPTPPQVRPLANKRTFAIAPSLAIARVAAGRARTFAPLRPRGLCSLHPSPNRGYARLRTPTHFCVAPPTHLRSKNA